MKIVKISINCIIMLMVVLIIILAMHRSSLFGAKLDLFLSDFLSEHPATVQADVLINDLRNFQKDITVTAQIDRDIYFISMATVAFLLAVKTYFELRTPKKCPE